MDASTVLAALKTIRVSIHAYPSKVVLRDLTA